MTKDEIIECLADWSANGWSRAFEQRWPQIHFDVSPHGDEDKDVLRHLGFEAEKLRGWA